jgi:hypothetical protein
MVDLHRRPPRRVLISWLVKLLRRIALDPAGLCNSLEAMQVALDLTEIVLQARRFILPLLGYDAQFGGE